MAVEVAQFHVVISGTKWEFLSLRDWTYEASIHVDTGILVGCHDFHFTSGRAVVIARARPSVAWAIPAGTPSLACTVPATTVEAYAASETNSNRGRSRRR
jgi:hypothetical protein